MQERWYGDNRDLIKWSVLIHLADEHSISDIVQVAFLQPDDSRPTVSDGSASFQVPDDVWQHFRDLCGIERLGESSKVKIHVVREPFDHGNRDAYTRHVQRSLKKMRSKPKILFLDPDTGLQPQGLTARHVAKDELRVFWSSLDVGDALVLYQHARRTRSWCAEVRKEVSSLIGRVPVAAYRSNEVGRDVAFFVAAKPAGV